MNITRIAIVALCALCSAPAFAEHPPEHMSLHERFYSSWMMPDAPAVSCCHNEDCKPAQAKFEDGDWWGRWSDDLPWVRIPAHKVERNRDTPDGRAHMCGRIYSDGAFDVFCFVTGGAS